MEFITGLPTTLRKHDSIMVVEDKLSKTTQFILVKSTYKDDEIEIIFIKEIFKLHGLPKAIVSNRNTKFISNFWKSFCKFGYIVEI